MGAARKTADQKNPEPAKAVVEEVVVEETTKTADVKEAAKSAVVEEVSTKTSTSQVKFLQSGESRIYGNLYRYTKGQETKLPSDVAGILQNSGKLAIIK